MAIRKIPVVEFLALAQQHLLLDVRSPGEYSHAHIPGAVSLPLFNDEERKEVGTAYKQESREKAIKLGLRHFGGRMVQMVETVEELLRQRAGDAGNKTVLVHCWRGGMRSAGVAWLLDLYGFKVYSLAGGYKAYRGWVLEQFDKEYPFTIIGGYTGSAKTRVLKKLGERGEIIVDLEDLASHKGSAFGNIGLPPQPTQEMFENRLARALNETGSSQRVWLEDESQRIGNVNLPSNLFRFMRTRPVLFLDVPFEDRLTYLEVEYGGLDREKLVNSILRIQKRLGGLETKNAVGHLQDGNTRESFRILLKYYDKWYGKSLQLRDNWEQLVHQVPCRDCDAATNAATLQSILAPKTAEVNG